MMFSDVELDNIPALWLLEKNNITFLYNINAFDFIGDVRFREAVHSKIPVSFGIGHVAYNFIIWAEARVLFSPQGFDYTSEI